MRQINSVDNRDQIPLYTTKKWYIDQKHYDQYEQFFGWMNVKENENFQIARFSWSAAYKCSKSGKEEHTEWIWRDFQIVD